MSRDAHAVSCGREGTYDNAGVPTVRIVEGLRHLLAVATPKLRNNLRPADLQNTLGAERPIVGPLTVISDVKLTQLDQASRQDEGQRDRSHFDQRLSLRRGNESVRMRRRLVPPRNL